MSVTLYDTVVVPTQRALVGLRNILNKAKASPKADALPTVRLIDDMHPLTFQVYISTDFASKIAARFGDLELPTTTKEDINTWDDMFGALDVAEKKLASINKDTVNSKLGKIFNVGMGPGKTLDIPAEGFAFGQMLPNIYFHITVAYSICRKEGVELGKMDYLMPHLQPYMGN